MIRNVFVDKWCNDGQLAGLVIEGKFAVGVETAKVGLDNYLQSPIKRGKSGTCMTM